MEFKEHKKSSQVQTIIGNFLYTAHKTTLLIHGCLSESYLNCNVSTQK